MTEDLRALELFREVLARTKEGRLAWEPTANAAEYVAPFSGKFTLLLRPGSGFWPALILKTLDGRELFQALPEVEGLKIDDLRTLYKEVEQRAVGAAGEEVDQALADLRRL